MQNLSSLTKIFILLYRPGYFLPLCQWTLSQCWGVWVLMRHFTPLAPFFTAVFFLVFFPVFSICLWCCHSNDHFSYAHPSLQCFHLQLQNSSKLCSSCVQSQLQVWWNIKKWAQGGKLKLELIRLVMYQYFWTNRPNPVLSSVDIDLLKRSQHQHLKQVPHEKSIKQIIRTWLSK